MSAKLGTALAALESMDIHALRREWRRVWKAEPPQLSRDLLKHGIAWRLQVKAHGGLPAITKRELDRLVRAEREGRSLVPVRTAKPGTRLVRQWHGRTYHVTVLEQGYLHANREYASLTQIACEITGAHWSGPRFFGLAPVRSDRIEP